MKRYISLLLLFALAGVETAKAQSSVGIGTNSPNPRTSLHVDAPNGDKGFMMPRLTTTQRNAMAPSLGSSDNGLMVFDTNLNQLFSWSGSAWQSVSRVALPYRDTNRMAINGNPIFQLVNDYVGNDGGFMARFVNRNPNHVGAPLAALTNSTQFTGAAFYAEHTGTGDVAGAFRVDNVASQQSALYAETNGTGSGVSGNALGTGSSVRGVKQAGAAGNAVNGIHRGTSGHAGLFQITNAANSSGAVRIETLGSSQALEITSAGSAAAINVTKPAASSGQGIYIDHLGDAGPVAQFRRSNPNANGAAIIGYSNSNQNISPAMYGNHEGTGDAAIVGRINNVGNQWAAVYGETNGTGSAMYARHIGVGGSALFVVQEGTGRAGQFQIGNPANTEAALRGFTNGTGRAGFFTINNAANTSVAVYAQTNGTGSALMGSNSNNGFALALEAGGLKVTTAYLTGASSTISTRATAYLISSGGPYTLGFSLEEGEIIFFHNLTASPVTINGIPIPANAGKTYITFAGILREM